MPAVASYSPSGNAYIDGILGDLKWAVNSFTYSFPSQASLYGSGYGSGETADNFGALNTAQQAAVRSALKMYASVANLSFSEIAETATQHADLRFAESDRPGTAWAYFPTTSAVGGDAWFNSTDYNSPVKGNYAYLTFIHEIGHALGLEHSHESGMPADRDSMEYTVMSYRSYIGASTTTGYVNETWGYAQSLMMYDIAAIQQMYGANYATNGGNTTYKWNAATGEMTVNGAGQGAPGGNKILLTVWDGGGTDTYDFSNYTTNLKVDLRPGQWTTTSATQLAKLNWDGSKVAAGNIASALLYKGDVRSLIENAVGGSGSDSLTGNDAANSLQGGAGDDRLVGGAGDDVLDGGTGTDTVAFGGLRSNYSVSVLSDGSLQVTDLRSGTPDGKDFVKGAEWFQFSDKTYSLPEMSGATTIVPKNLTLSGGTGNNTLTGGAGNDTLDGKGGNDRLYGHDGVDVLTGGAGRDYLDGGAGTDTASYATALKGVYADLMSATGNTNDAYGDAYVSIENLTGSSYADSLRGNAAGNLIRGGAGNDSLYGRDGNDVLRGDSGADILSGGSGPDVFDFNSIKESTTSAPDRILDFVRGVDHIDLSTIDANSKLSGNQAFSFIGNKAFSGHAGQLKFSGGVLSGDTNGDKVADFHIKVAGVSALTSGDFYL